MLKRLVLSSVVVMVATVVAVADTNTIAGILTEVEPGRIVVMTDKKQTMSMMLNANTKYRKWIMAKPWQQDPNASLQSLKVGMRVRIDVEKDNPMTAKTVWIVVR